MKTICLQELPDFKGTLPPKEGPVEDEDLEAQWRWWASAVRRFVNQESAGNASAAPASRVYRRATEWFLVALNAALLRTTGQGLERFVIGAQLAPCGRRCLHALTFTP